MYVLLTECEVRTGGYCTAEFFSRLFMDRAEGEKFAKMLLANKKKNRMFKHVFNLFRLRDRLIQ